MAGYRAKEACANSGHQISDHFVQMHDMIEIGKGGRREVDDVRLSRYACYLIVQNASPDKQVVALGQTYFAGQTRLQEIRQMDDYNKLTKLCHFPKPWLYVFVWRIGRQGYPHDDQVYRRHNAGETACGG